MAIEAVSLKDYTHPTFSRIAIFFPWEILNNDAGASRRVNLLVRFLLPLCEEIRVFSHGVKENFRRGNVEYIFVRPAFNRRILLGISKRIFPFFRSGLQVHELNTLRAFDIFSGDKSFARVVERTLAGCEVAFLEYPFWATEVLPLCKKHGIKSILTLYDVLATSVVPRPDMSKVIFEKELHAIEMADHICCVSSSDKAFFELRGTRELECVVNPVDFEACQEPVTQEQVAEFRRQYHLDNKPVCLFFGSPHFHNITAVEHIKEIAKQTPGCNFLLAGPWNSKDYPANVISVGPAVGLKMRILYSLADIVLIPLAGGTGTSLKMVEALAYGKPIITSTIGCRGYLVENGVQAIICDEFGAYPELIGGLLVDKDRQVYLSQNARLLGESYDYRNEFRKYWKFLKAGGYIFQ